MGISRWAALATCGAVTVGAAQSPPPESASSLFSSDTPLHVRIEAPLHTLFAARKDSTQEVVGTLTYTDEGGRPIAVPNVTFSLRGNTSLQEGECTFPKLKARFPKGQLPRINLSRSENGQ